MPLILIRLGPKRKRYNDLLEVFACRLYNTLNDRVHILATFVDFSKAFDTLGHSKLLEMLKFCGARGIVLKCFEKYLKDRKFVVKLEKASVISNR